MNSLTTFFILLLGANLQSSTGATGPPAGSIPIYKKDVTPAGIEIENFGKVNDRYYRGSEPKNGDYEKLARFGVKTIINLRHHPNDRVKPSAERAGLRYINLPMYVRGYPSPDLAPRFLALVNDPENWPVYVYCHGGRHRTGVMTAIYRMAVEGWDIQRAYAEMRRYGFYKRWGHGPLKAYVFDYYRRLKYSDDQNKCGERITYNDESRKRHQPFQPARDCVLLLSK
jgi:protein tyrosine/serine phosphatase